MSAEFGSSAVRLAGMAGAVLGWTPHAFWRVTPAELAAVVAALTGEGSGTGGGGGGGAPADAATLARLKEAFPDG